MTEGSVKAFSAYPVKTMTAQSISPAQTRAARGWLGWSQSELAKRAGVSLSTVQDFERGQRTPISNNMAALRRALEAAGVRLIFDGKGAAGILRADAEHLSSELDAPGSAQ